MGKGSVIKHLYKPQLPKYLSLLRQYVVKFADVFRHVAFLLFTRLVSALVLSWLDYCNAIFVGLPQTTLSSLQRVLHAAARMVLNLRPCDHVTPALLELHWLPIAERIDFKLCLLVHKALVGHAPQCIADLIRPVADLPSPASLRTAHSGDLYVPRTCRRFGDRAFAVAAPRVWNSLPTDIKVHRSTTTCFKRRLKTALFNRASLNICKWLCNALPVF